jgi:hypothetical protein
MEGGGYEEGFDVGKKGRRAGIQRGEEDEGEAADAWAPDVSVTSGKEGARVELGQRPRLGLGPSGSGARERGRWAARWQAEADVGKSGGPRALGYGRSGLNSE